MSDGGLAEQKWKEEQKRQAVLTPAKRWHAILSAIAWAEKQPGVSRNTPAWCLRGQRQALARLQPPQTESQ